MYRIIDLGGVDVSGSGATISGVYDRVEETAKALLIRGLYNGTTEFKDFIAPVYVSGTSFVINIDGTHTLTIASTDKVTYA